MLLPPETGRPFSKIQGRRPRHTIAAEIECRQVRSVEQRVQNGENARPTQITACGRITEQAT